MADIVDSEAVHFANEKVRVMADALSLAYYTAKSIVNDWNARSMSAKITNTSDVIVDGSATDGRSTITGAKATSIITRAIEFIADYEAGSNAKLNTVLVVRVNGQGLF